MRGTKDRWRKNCVTVSHKVFGELSFSMVGFQLTQNKPENQCISGMGEVNGSYTESLLYNKQFLFMLTLVLLVTSHIFIIVGNV